jgi:molybdate transport system substrate-binding protein
MASIAVVLVRLCQSAPLRRWQLLALACWIGGCAAAQAGEVHVAVAANFAAPMARIAQSFTAATGHVVKLSSGATGKFYAQIVAGAPFELLLAADDQTPKRLVDEGHAVASSRFTYATGRLVLWSATPGFVDAQGAVLASGRFAHLAIASPKVAPYGRAAMEVLHARGLADALAPKLVTGESIAQAFKFVATGNAELGLVALSQVQVPGRPAGGSAWRVPESLHAPILQDAVLLKAGEHNPAASALLAYLKTAAARELMRSFGYGP